MHEGINQDNLETVYLGLFDEHMDGIPFLDADLPTTRDENFELLETMSAAYTDLSLAVQANVQAWHRGESSLLRKHVQPCGWANGEVVATDTSYVINGSQPEFVTSYMQLSNLAFSSLLNEAMQTGDFTHPLAIITLYNESDLAKQFLADMYRRKVRYPDSVVGASPSRVRSEIDYQNSRTKLLGRIARAHGKSLRHDELYKKLHHPDTNVLGALSILLATKTGLGTKKYTENKVIQPIQRIAKMPSVVMQLVEREKAGLSIFSYDD